MSGSDATSPERVAPRVLVVDDRPENILAVEAVLDGLDVQIIRALSGTEALRTLLTDDVAVILLDVQMPDLDGFETARHIKDRARTKHIPIIFLTAISREVEQQLEGYSSGAVDYMSKPFEPVVLRSKVLVFAELYTSRKLVEEQNRQLAAQLEELEQARSTLADQAVELQRSNAALDQLAAVASHSLREPVWVIDGFLELLAGRYGDQLSADAADLVARARSGATRVLARIDDLLEVAKAGAVVDQHDPVELQAVLDGAMNTISDLLDSSGASIDADPLPRVLGDVWALEQLFVQLIEHAVAAGASQVRITVTRQDDQWVVNLHDDGTGIDAAELGRLFSPMQGADGDDRVGLLLAKRVVERHGGTIWAESTAGRGTSVSFTLPAEATR